MRSNYHSPNPAHWHTCEVCHTLQPIVGQTGGGYILTGCGHPQSTFLLTSPNPLREDSQTSDFVEPAA